MDTYQFDRAGFLAAMRVVATHAATTDVRKYLHHVQADVRGDRLTLLASDGYRVATTDTVDLSGLGACLPEGVTLLHGGDLRAVLKAAKRPKAPGRLTVTPHNDAWSVADNVTGETWAVRVVSDHVVDLRRAIPRATVETESLGVNAEYLAEAAKVLAGIANSKYHGIRMDFSGQNGAMVLSTKVCAADFPDWETARVVIMSMRL